MRRAVPPSGPLKATIGDRIRKGPIAAPPPPREAVEAATAEPKGKPQPFGEALRRIRIANKVSKGTLAELIGVVPSAVGNWEDGLRLAPGMPAKIYAVLPELEREIKAGTVAPPATQTGKRTQWTPEQRRDAVALALHYGNHKRAAIELGLSPSLISTWLKGRKGHPPTAAAPRVASTPVKQERRRGREPIANTRILTLASGPPIAVTPAQKLTRGQMHPTEWVTAVISRAVQLGSAAEAGREAKLPGEMIAGWVRKQGLSEKLRGAAMRIAAEAKRQGKAPPIVAPPPAVELRYAPKDDPAAKANVVSALAKLAADEPRATPHLAKFCETVGRGLLDLAAALGRAEALR